MGVASSWETFNAGVLQGSILGPILFIVFSIDIVNRINSTTRLFADDTILYKVINQPISAGIELNTTVKNITEWALEWLVKFSSGLNVVEGM